MEVDSGRGGGVNVQLFAVTSLRGAEIRALGAHRRATSLLPTEMETPRAGGVTRYRACWDMRSQQASTIKTHCPPFACIHEQ